MEFKKGETRMLHQLIEMAMAGKKFKALHPHTRIAYLQHHFIRIEEWSIAEITNPWQYEEIIERRIVEFRCEWKFDGERGLYPVGPFGDAMDVAGLSKKLIGGKFKVVCIEVIEVDDE